MSYGLPPLCPKCGLRPSRRPLVYRGKIPHCLPCVIEATRERNARTNARRSRGGPKDVLRPPPGEVREGRPPSRYGYDDLPAAEIERRFAAALKQIKARPWDEREL